MEGRGETEKERMCERQPMDRATPGRGEGGGRGEVGAWSGCREDPSVPPNRAEGLVSRIGSLWPG